MVPALYRDIVPSSNEIEAIIIEEIISEQQKHQPPDGVGNDGDEAYKKGQQIWIPDEAPSL